jgi:hypothetical protein
MAISGEGTLHIGSVEGVIKERSVRKRKEKACVEGIGEVIFTALLIILNTANPFHLHHHLPFYHPDCPMGI